MIDRVEIEAMLAVAEELHFARAAERLRVSPARVSQIVATLERRVGTRLFDRTSRRVDLTPAGHLLVGEVRPHWEAIDTAFRRSMQFGRGLTGTLRVGFAGPAAGQLVAGAAKLFRDRHPECDVELLETGVTLVHEGVRNGKVEVALSTVQLEHAGLRHGPVLVREAQVLAVPVAHPLQQRATVAIEELQRLPVLTLASDRTFGGLTAATIHEALTLVGAGVGVLPIGAHAQRYYRRPDVTYVPLTGAESSEWALLWWPGGETARLRAFSQAASDLLAESR